MKMRHFLAGIVVMSAGVVFAQDKSSTSMPVGWRGDGTGVFQGTNPPTTWSRIAKNSIVTGLYCSAVKPKGEAAEGALINDGIPRNWLVLGPFDGTEIDTPCLPNEGTLTPEEGNKTGGKEWTPYGIPTEKEISRKLRDATWNKSPEYYQRISAEVGATEKQSVLAHTYLFSPRAGKVRLYMSHSGGIKIWVNGKEAYKTDKGGGMDEACSEWAMAKRMDHRRFLRNENDKNIFADLELQKGWNRILVKLTRGTTLNPVFYDQDEMQYESKNILWMTKLPDWGNCSPIVVKDKVFVTAEPDLLICLDRNTGKILWKASNSYYEATPQEERDKNPLFKEKITPLYEKLLSTKNEDEEMELRFQIQQALEKVSVDKYPWHRVKTVRMTGFTMPTPASDGKNVYFVNTLGVAAAYDLDGKRKWIKLITEYGDHGRWRDKYNTQFWNFASPLVVGDTLYINRSGLAALDAETGKEKWYMAELYAKGNNPYEGRPNEAYYSQYQTSSPVYGKVGDTDFIVSNCAWVKLPEGKLLGSAGGNINTPTPVFNEGKLYGSNTHIVEPDMSTMGSDKPVFKTKSFDGVSSLTSPVFYKGLLYVCTYNGLLMVCDPETMKVLYKQQLDLDCLLLYYTIGGGFLTADGMGRVYVMDNQGGTVVLEVGRTFKQLAKNRIENFERRIYCVPQQETGQSYMFIDGKNIFIRAEENLYCIGEK